MVAVQESSEAFSARSPGHNLGRGSANDCEAKWEEKRQKNKAVLSAGDPGEKQSLSDLTS